MREIKFRVFSEEPNEMFYQVGFLGKELFIDIEGDGGFDNVGHINKIQDVLIQYTGLKDKNGVEIYEGDIVKFNPLYERKGTVKITPYETVIDDGYEEWSIMKDEVLEVIGNTYENPELLEGEE